MIHMAFCTYCGGALEEGVKFCTNCGAPVEEAAPAAAPPISQDPQAPFSQPPQQEPSNQEPYQQQQQPSFDQPQAEVVDSGSIGWAILGFFIPIVGLVLFLVWKNTKPQSAKMAGMGALISVLLAAIFRLMGAY